MNSKKKNCAKFDYPNMYILSDIFVANNHNVVCYKQKLFVVNKSDLL